MCVNERGAAVRRRRRSGPNTATADNITPKHTQQHDSQDFTLHLSRPARGASPHVAAAAAPGFACSIDSLARLLAVVWLMSQRQLQAGKRARSERRTTTDDDTALWRVQRQRRGHMARSFGCSAGGAACCVGVLRWSFLGGIEHWLIDRGRHRSKSRQAERGTTKEASSKQHTPHAPIRWVDGLTESLRPHTPMHDPTGTR